MKSRWVFFFGVLAFLLAYTGFKFGQIMPGRKWTAWILTCVTLALAFSWQFLYRAHAEASDSPWLRALIWAGAGVLGVWATFVLLSLPADLLNGFVRLKSHVLAAPLDPERRRFLSFSFPLGLLGVSGVIAGLGFVEAMGGPRIKEIGIPVRGLPKALEGLKIAQISDLHVGPTIRRGYVEEVVRRTMELRPDLIAVTGDLADGTPDLLRAHVLPLAGLKARLGIFYVTGNHEYYWGAERWIEMARELGFVPLLNEHRIIEAGGEVGEAKILVAGVTDTSGGEFLSSHRSDPWRAMGRAMGQAMGGPSGDCAFKLLLAHRPESCFEAEPAGFDLQISGHTHAGQFFPWSVLVRFAHKYYRGLNRHGRMWVYVNAGTGYWGPVDRFAIPSEITLFRLERES